MPVPEAPDGATSDDEKKGAGGPPAAKRKRRYEAPRLSSFGSVARLTKGAGGASADFMNNRFKRL